METGTSQDHTLSTINSDVISKNPTEAPEVQPEESISTQIPVFFNYHEFTERYYVDFRSPSHFSEHAEDSGLCITHFPNVYVPRNTKEFKNTRIVRIPRRFDITLDYPYFSTCLPGSEPAALINEIDQDAYVPHGIFDDNQVFGYSSVSPLSRYFTQSEFEEIVTSINHIMSRTARISSWFNILNLVADIFTLGVWEWVIARHVSKDPIQEVEEYIVKLNEAPAFKNRNIKIHSPRSSGYLSVCKRFVFWW